MNLPLATKDVPVETNTLIQIAARNSDVGTDKNAGGPPTRIRGSACMNNPSDVIALLLWQRETLNRQGNRQLEFKLIDDSARSSATIELELFVSELKTEIDVVIGCNILVAKRYFDMNLVAVD